jgi:hypothetical protein
VSYARRRLLELVEPLLLLHQVLLQQLLLLLLLLHLELLLLELKLELLVLLQVAHAVLRRRRLARRAGRRRLQQLALLPRQFELFGVELDLERAQRGVVHRHADPRTERQVRLLLQQFLSLFVLLQAELLLLLLQTQDLLALENRGLRLRVRRVGQHEQQADHEQPLRHGATTAESSAFVVAIVPPDIKVRSSTAGAAPAGRARAR